MGQVNRESGTLWRKRVACAAVFLGLTVASLDVELQAAVTFAFTKIAETGNAMPDFAGNFGGFRALPALDGDRVAFVGSHDSSAFHGVYTAVGGVLQLVADRNTPFPSGQDTFLQFASEVSVSGNRVAFTVSGGLSNQKGIYLWTNESLTTIADNSDAIPGGVGSFTDPREVDLDGSDGVFESPGAPVQGTGQFGIYANVGETLYKVADRSTAVPGGTDDFWSFDSATVDDGVVVFQGEERFSSGMEGIYSAPVMGGAVTMLVDENTLVPGRADNFVNFGPGPSSSSGNVVFEGQRLDSIGVRRDGIYTIIDGALGVLADHGDPIPGSSDAFTGFGRFSISGANVAFTGSGGLTSGIYMLIDGARTKVIDRTDTLEGKTITRFDISRQSLSGRSVAFKVTLDDQTQAIYVATAEGSPGDCPGSPPGTTDTDGDGTCDDIDSDDDNDGMSDVFETDNLLDPLDPADALEDADLDDFTNLAESQAGTDPNDPTSVPTSASGTPLLVAATLPTSRSVQVGEIATAFATIINLGTDAATACSFVPLRPLPAEFFYRTTDATTNEVIGAVNEPVTIADGASQSFVFALLPTAAFDATVVELGFRCANRDAATVVPGLNTLLLSSSITPVPDIIALAATQTADGIVGLPSETGANAFSVATVNLGVGSTITASADSGNVELPVVLFICATDASAQCLTTPATSVIQDIASNAIPTFSIFVNANGEVPFDPANHRIFVRFKDAAGITRGSTSVAVKTIP